ncbi:FtsX-like permease family protein [uncultured Tessaracoccus sp.]|uniref:ABC transporter permease n=1 Tax=uncultured Tessaracoccus sp. TaxID=905023 RepID=UPI002636593D|nr:FtsX-like permease family protein [uncultured Tessaracoccus sp.]
MSAWRAVLRLASRDARRHLTRTILAALLIALPVAALGTFFSISSPGAPVTERVLASIPDGAQAIITAAALPQGGPPFPQIPEGAPGPWFDDEEVRAADPEQIRAALPPAIELSEYWMSPSLVASPELGLQPGQEQTLDSQVKTLAGKPPKRLAMVELWEGEPWAFAANAPRVVAGTAPTTPSEVIVTRSLADRLHIKVGDSLGFLAPPDRGVRSFDGNLAAAMNDSARGYRVAGIADASGARAWAPSGWLSSLAAKHPEGLQRHWFAHGSEPVTWTDAKALNKLQAFAISRHVLEHYPAADELYPVDIDPAQLMEGAIGVAVALVVGGLLVFFLVTPAIAISAEQSRRTLGLAGAVGATPRHLRRIVLSQGLVIGVFGAVLGCVLAVASAAGFGALLGAMVPAEDSEQPRFGAGVALANFPWWVLVAGACIAVLLGLIAAWGPARSVARLSVVDALRDRPSVRAERRRRGRSLIVGPALLGISVLIGAATLLARVPEHVARQEADMELEPGSLPPGATVFVVGALLAIMAALAGLAITVRGLLPLLGRLGDGRRPVWKLALRDAADHPSRTVPAVLGVLFSLLAASYLLVMGASKHADSRATGESVDWKGTFIVSPTVSIDPVLDRAIADAALEELSRSLPEVDGSHPVEALAQDSPTLLLPLQPKGRECPKGTLIHAASARTPGAPLRCVSQPSGAAFGSGTRFGSPESPWDPPVLMDGPALHAMRLPGADAAAQMLDSGGVLVSDASLIDDDGRVRLARIPREKLDTLDIDPRDEVRLPAKFVRGIGTGLVMSPSTARGLGLDLDHIGLAGVLADTSKPLDEATLERLSKERVGGLVWVTIPDSTDPLGATGGPEVRAATWGPTVLLGALSVAAAAIAVLLSATQGRRDAITAYAVGASRGVLVRIGLARAAVILLFGVPLGLGAGLAVSAYHVAWNRRIASSGAWLDTVPLWGYQATLGAGVIVAGMLAALLLTRPPRRLVRRGLD